MPIMTIRMPSRGFFRFRQWASAMLAAGLVTLGAPVAAQDAAGGAGPQPVFAPGLAAALTGVDSQRLQPFVPQLGEVVEQARASGWGFGQAQATRLAQAITDTPVTAEEMPLREAVATAARILAAGYAVAQGDPQAARNELRRLQATRLPRELRAQAALAEAFGELLAGDWRAAVAAERRARSLDPQRVLPVHEAGAAIFQGNPAVALRQLEPWLRRGGASSLQALYAGMAAGCLNDVGAAQAYLEAARADLTGVPIFAVADGLTHAMTGDVAGARACFAEGAAHERGPIKLATLLNGVAMLALGERVASAQQLNAALGGAPTNAQWVVRDLLAQPSPGRAAAALSQPRFWWAVNGYAPGTLLTVPVDTPAPAVQPSALAANLPPAMAGLAEAMGQMATGLVNGMSEALGLTSPPPTIAAPAAPPAAATAAGAPASSGSAPPDEHAEPASAAAGGDQTSDGRVQERGGETGARLLAPRTQAVAAYQSARRHLAAARVDEAVAALQTAVALEPSYADAWLALGQVLFHSGNDAPAEAAYRAALRFQPTSAAATYGLALVRERQGEAEDAHRLFRRALALGLDGPPADYAPGR